MSTHRAVAAGINHFACDRSDLRFVSTCLTAVRLGLREVNRGSRRYHPVPLPNTDLRHLREALERELDETEPGGAVIVYLSTYASRLPKSNTLHLVTADCDRGPGWAVESWLRRLAETATSPNVMLLLDLVGSEDCVRYLDTTLRMLAQERKIWILAACSSDRSADGGRLSRMIAETMSQMKKDGLQADPALEFVPPERFVHVVAQAVAKSGGDMPFLLAPAAHRAWTQSPFFENPNFRSEVARYRSLTEVAELRAFIDELGPVFDASFFVDRTFGGPDPLGELDTCLFSGRRRQLDELARWMNHATAASNLRVVTGGPGAGKSALLGVLVCAAHPQFPEQLRGRLPTEVRLPRLLPGMAAVHARDRSLEEIAESVALQLGLENEGETWTPSLVVTALAEGRSAHPSPLLIIDALDEARGPRDVVELLLNPLIRATRVDDPTAPACRLIVGTRPWWDDFPTLLAAAEQVRGLIDLDATPTAETRSDLAGFARRFLETSHRYGQESERAIREQLALVVAETLVPSGADSTVPTRLGAGPFLVAGLYLHHLLSRAVPLRVSEIPWVRRDVPRTLAGVLDLHLAHAGGRWDRAVLTALAHARGRGIPLGALRATSFDPSTNEPPSGPDDAQVLEVIDRIGFYLRRSVDDRDGTTLYRLFHQGLVEQLRAPSRTGTEA